MKALLGSPDHLSNIPSDLAFKIILANRIADSLSILGCLFNLFTTVLLKASDYTLGKMVVLLCITDLIYNGISVIQSFHQIENWMCQTTTFFSFFGYAGSLCCTICFAHALYVSVTYDQVKAIDSFLKLYVMSSCVTGFAGATLSVVLGYAVVDNEVQLCLHRKTAETGEIIDWAMLVIVLIPLIIALLICSLCYLAIIRKLKKFNKKRSYLELFLYPLILVICYLPGAIKALYESLANDDVSEAWDIAVNVLFNLQGFLNAFAYGLSQRIMRGYKEKICRKKASRGSTPGKVLSSIGSQAQNPSLLFYSVISEERDPIER